MLRLADGLVRVVALAVLVLAVLLAVLMAVLMAVELLLLLLPGPVALALAPSVAHVHTEHSVPFVVASLVPLVAVALARKYGGAS